MMENSASTIAPLLLRNLLTSILDKSLLHLSHNHKLLQLLRTLLISAFLLFLRLLPSYSQNYPSKPKTDNDRYAPTGDSGISRALSQLLQIMNEIPVSSRKYDVVRSLAEKLLDDNLSEAADNNNNNRVLREVNCVVLSAAFGRTMSQLEAAVAEQGRRSGGGDVAADEGDLGVYSRVSRLLKYFGCAAWRCADLKSRLGSSAEKLAAELLWLAQKMAASGCVEEAVCEWASASNLAWLALSAEPRLQGSLVKVSAFLIKQAKEMGSEEEEYDEKKSRPLTEHHNMMKMKMLMSWLPLLCRHNNGTDTPTLSMPERAELERILEEIISTLGEEEEQECVLSLWLHHFTYCSASDWPNLHSCYTQWCSASRARLVLATSVS